jgi:putative ABC transport system permease protein
LVLDNQSFTVIGVLPKTFRFELTSTADLWVPAVIRPEGNRASNEWLVLGRLSPRVSLSAAKTEMNLIAAQLQKEFPKEDSNQGIAIIPYLNWMNRAGNDRLFLIFFGAVILVLLIAVANLGGLIVARYADRGKQIALRIALGASRTRIIRMLLAESLAVTTMGGGAGVALAYVLTSIFRTRVSTIPLVRADLIHVDGPILIFALMISLGTGVLFGIGPALKASRPDLNGGLKEGGTAEAGRHSRIRTRSLLVVTEIALSLVLLASAGLLLRSMISELRTDPGYGPEHLLTFWIMPPQQRYPTDDSLDRLYDLILQNVAAIPSVQSAAISNTLPPMGNEVDGGFIVESHPPDNPNSAPITIDDAISPNYFSTMKIQVIQGRPFSEQDNRPAAPKTVIISRSFAKRYFTDENPIGQHIKFDVDGFTHSWVVIGVVADTRYFGWDHDDGIFSYFPYAALGGRDRIGIAVRSQMNPAVVTASVEHAVWSVDKELPLFDIAAMDRKLSDSFAPRRFNTALLGSFAAAAVILAAIGIFGLLANLVARQRREIGVRMALGARREDVLRGVLLHSLRLTLYGMSIGLPVAFVAAKALRGLLYNTQPIDPLMFSAAIAVIFSVSLAASHLPARRAASVDPMQALRSE